LNLLLQARYRAIKLIAQGGFGRTFIAVDEGQSPALPCVIKQLWTRNLNPEALPKATALFQQEALRLQELGNHPQLPTLLAYFEQNQLLYLVQELIDGSNLAEVVAETGIFNQAQIWQLLDNLLPVIKFIHDHQIIHRDIKPENIIRRREIKADLTSVQTSSPTPNSQLPTPPQFVLVDFGAAKLLTGTEILEKGTRIGSPEYVAPEQVRGKAVFASDLYSLGVTCIYLLTGIAPFDLFDVVNDCWAWRDYLTQEVSVSLTQILDKLLAYPLTHRFQSVEEVMQAMNQVSREETENVLEFQQENNLQPTPILWQCLYTLDHHAGVNSVAISRDGMLLASGGNDQSIRLWDINTRATIAILKAHTAAVKSVAFSPDGTILASSSDDQTIKLWNLSDRQEIYTLSGHSHAVKSVAFSPNHHLLASGSWDKTIKLWDIHKGLLERTFKGHSLQVTAVAFSPCGKLIASASCDRTVRLWELASGSSFTLVGHYRSVVAVAFSPDGTMLATGSDDNTVILWNLKTEKPLYTLSGHSWSVVAVAFSPDGETLVTGSWDKTIKLWQVSSGKEIATLTGHLDSVCAVAISPNGEMIASGSQDKTVKVLQIFLSML
jgi:serine/threonine protein kinase